jgi:hypothetical protein
MRWIADEEGDIGLTFWNVVSFVKYKNSVLIQFFTAYHKPAPKYLYA